MVTLNKIVHGDEYYPILVGWPYPSSCILVPGVPTEPIELDLNIFDQGPVGDCLGNKSVKQISLDGNLTIFDEKSSEFLPVDPVTKYKGSLVGVGGFRSDFPSGYYWYPRFRLGSREYHVLGIGWTGMGSIGWSNANGMYTISGTYTWSYDGKYFQFEANCDINRYNGDDAGTRPLDYVSLRLKDYHCKQRYVAFGPVITNAASKNWKRTSGGSYTARWYDPYVSFWRSESDSFSEQRNFTFRPEVWKGPSSLTNFSIDTNYLNAKFDSELEQILHPLDGNNPPFSELMVEAMHSSTAIDNNMTMFLKDMVSLKEDFQGLKDSMETLLTDTSKHFTKSGYKKWLSSKEGLKLSKDVANVYLPLLYGYGLTFDEALELGEKLDELRHTWSSYFSLTKARAQRKGFLDGDVIHKYDLRYTANIKPKDNPFSQLYAVLQHSGFQIGLKDAWDFIPYSFCIDWILGVGDMLDALDSKGWQCNYTLFSTVKSVKTDVVAIDASLLSTKKLELNGQTLGVSLYKRWIERVFDSPPPLIEWSASADKLWQHRYEATALIVQRL